MRQAGGGLQPCGFGVGVAELNASGCGNAHRFLHSGHSGGLDLGNLVQRTVGQARDAADGAGSHVDQQLVPHHAQDVVADHGRQPRRVENSCQALGAHADAAVQLADQRFLARHATDDPAWRQHHAADIGLAGQHMVPAHDVGQDVFMPQPVLQ